MNDRIESNPNDPTLELDVLIGRIVDGEASEDARRRFETLAASDAFLWRRLALRQQDMAMLAVHVEPTLNGAEAVELPVTDGEHAITSPIMNGHAGQFTQAARWPWWMAATGWAAVLALAAVWGSSIWSGHARMQDAGPGGMQTDARLVNATPEEHLQKYMQAPYVMGDMPPTLLQVDQLPDGRYAVSYLRRIVEVKYYDAADQIPLDGDGNLTDSPRQVRKPGPVAPAPSKPRD